jgi:hypothetical protein
LGLSSASIPSANLLVVVTNAHETAKVVASES